MGPRQEKIVDSLTYEAGGILSQRIEKNLPMVSPYSNLLLESHSEVNSSLHEEDDEENDEPTRKLPFETPQNNVNNKLKKVDKEDQNEDSVNKKY